MRFPMAPLPSIVGAFVGAKKIAAKHAPTVFEAVRTAICDAAFIVAYCTMRVVEKTPGAIEAVKEAARPVFSAARAFFSKVVEAAPGAFASAKDAARPVVSAARVRATACIGDAKEFAEKCGFYFFRTEKFGKMKAA